MHFSSQGFLVNCHPERSEGSAVVRLVRIGLILMLITSAANTAGQERKEVCADCYDVYSAVLSQQYGSWFKQKEPVLIAGHTVLEPQHHQGCPTQGEQNAVVQQLLNKLLAEKQELRIAAKLRLPGPYKIFSGKTEIPENREPGLVFLSAVEFSEDRSKAIVLVGHVCGGLCGGGYVSILERRNGDWHKASEQINCGWIN